MKINDHFIYCPSFFLQELVLMASHGLTKLTDWILDIALPSVRMLAYAIVPRAHVDASLDSLEMHAKEVISPSLFLCSLSPEVVVPTIAMAEAYVFHFVTSLSSKGGIMTLPLSPLAMASDLSIPIGRGNHFPLVIVTLVSLVQIALKVLPSASLVLSLTLALSSSLPSHVSQRR
jgi:hypothetical protein